MPRIAGVDVPKEKRIEISLTHIYGIGRSRSRQILAAAGVNPDTRAKDLTEGEVHKISETIPKICPVEGDVRRVIAGNIKRLIAVGCYRGLRHRKGLPVRGQRTHTNARTRKGPRQTVGVRKEKGAAPAAKPAAAASAKGDKK